MIKGLLTSGTRTELLEILLFNPEKEYHLREISRIVDKNPTFVKKELEKLEEAGLVKKRKKANLVLFKLNKESPIHRELKKIFIKTHSFGKVMREKLENYDKIKYALIYGSFAKGTERETSDIDLLIVGNPSEKNLQRTITKLEEKTGREINYIQWTEKELERKAEEEIPLLTEISEEKIMMIKGDEDEFRRTLEQK